MLKLADLAMLSGFIMIRKGAVHGQFRCEFASAVFSGLTPQWLRKYSDSLLQRKYCTENVI